MRSDATTVEAYLGELEDERRTAITTVRDVVLAHLQPGFEEGMQHGMISWFVPLERFPDTYNGQPLGLAALASQKRHMSLYLMNVYGDDETWFREQWEATGRALDMGKSCVRFRRLEDMALDVVGRAVARTSVDDLIAAHERAHAGRRR